MSSAGRPLIPLSDFSIPQSLILQLAKSPTPVFFTSYSLDALPQLNGSISYITTSEALEEIGPSKSVPFKNVVERFRVYPPPRRPVGKDEVWQGGKRVEGRDYLLYSRLHLPSLHLSGLATTRLTPTLQAHLAFLHQPKPLIPSRPNSPPTEPSSPPNIPSIPGNVLLSLQHDTGRYSGEYTYSAQDGMFGMRGLYNFGWHENTESRGEKEGREGNGKRIDEEEMMEGGLRGRFSAGGEVYFSAKQRSFGISTGLKFTTLPPPANPVLPNSIPPSPPTTLTLLYNPLIGFLSTAYSAQISPTIAVSSRFGVNVYSYESDLSVGGEWWIGRKMGKRDSDPEPEIPPSLAAETVTRGEVTLRELDYPSPVSSEEKQPELPVRTGGEKDERNGVLKARLTGNWSFALLYESRIRNCLVSVGVVADLVSRQRPITSVGLEVQYFS